MFCVSVVAPLKLYAQYCQTWRHAKGVWAAAPQKSSGRPRQSKVNLCANGSLSDYISCWLITTLWFCFFFMYYFWIEFLKAHIFSHCRSTMNFQSMTILNNIGTSPTPLFLYSWHTFRIYPHTHTRHPHNCRRHHSALPTYIIIHSFAFVAACKMHERPRITLYNMWCVRRAPLLARTTLALHNYIEYARSVLMMRSHGEGWCPKGNPIYDAAGLSARCWVYWGSWHKEPRK